MRLLGKKFKVVDPQNVSYGSVFTIELVDKETGYVFYRDQNGELYSTDDKNKIVYRVTSGMWQEVKQPKVTFRNVTLIEVKI
jgi:hypothetical protein